MIAKRREIDLENISVMSLHQFNFLLQGWMVHLLRQLKVNCYKNLSAMEAAIPLFHLRKTHFMDNYGMTLLQMLGHGKAGTFGELASKIFDVVHQLFDTLSVLRVEIVFDRYDTEHSIKEMERQRLQNVSGYEVQMYSSSVPLPKLWDKFMSSNTNKAELAKFLCEHWSCQYVACVPSGKMFLLSGGFADREKAVIIRDGSCEFCELLSCNHEEADTHLIFHASDQSRLVKGLSFGPQTLTLVF